MLFFSDLDNTLFYSHRHKPSGGVRCAEVLNGREQAFITEFAYSYLTSQTAYEIIPVTTRTFDQYARVQPMLKELGVKNALILNGAVLLKDGVEDDGWRRDSERAAQSAQLDLKRAMNAAEEIAGTHSVVSALPFLFYVKTGDPEKTERLLRMAGSDELRITRDSRKVYCVPRNVNKGSAVKRYCTAYEEGRQTLAAGDGDFDIDMLQCADIGIYPLELSGRINAKIGIAIPDGIFSDAVCGELQKREGGQKEL